MDLFHGNLCVEWLSQHNVELHKILLDLKNDKSIKLCKFDKGSGVFIINDYDYYAKLDDLVLERKN